MNARSMRRSVQKHQGTFFSATDRLVAHTLALAEDRQRTATREDGEQERKEAQGQ